MQRAKEMLLRSPLNSGIEVSRTPAASCRAEEFGKENSFDIIVDGLGVVN